MYVSLESWYPSCHMYSYTPMAITAAEATPAHSKQVSLTNYAWYLHSTTVKYTEFILLHQIALILVDQLFTLWRKEKKLFAYLSEWSKTPNTDACNTSFSGTKLVLQCITIPLITVHSARDRKVQTCTIWGREKNVRRNAVLWLPK